MTRPLRARLVALAAVLLCATTFFPLVQGVVWLVELSVVLVLAATAAALAHRTVGETLAAVAGLVAAALTLTWVFALPEAWLGLLPGTETVSRFAELLAQGSDTITTSAAPAPATPGLRMLTVAGLALVWWVVDLVAVVLRRPAVAGLALLAVYCVPTALVRDGLPWWWFVLAAAGYLVLLASDAQERVSRWGRVVGSSGRGAGYGEAEERASLSATGRRVGAMALAAAVVVPALVPGLSESLLPSGNLPGNGPGDGTIAVLNPILSLRDDLTANDDITVLEYQTEDRSPDPLRLVTVDSFDGETWEPTYGDIDRDQRAAGSFPSPPGLSPAAGAEPVSTSIRIEGLRQGWLPTPYPPTRIDIIGNWLYDETTLNVVGDDVETSEGLRYSVQYLDVDPEPAVLAAAGPAPADIVTRWTALPEGTPETIGSTALQVAGEGSQLEQATRLQSWFRSGGGFSYSLDAPPENGSSAVADFLDRRSGYCVHFASAMALMARSLGIPARVAVGWLPGEQIEPGRFRVSQQDAHAWPELYFQGAGWMRFEPTPATRAGTVPSWAAPVTPEPTDGPTSAAPTTSASAAAPTGVREAETPGGSTDRSLVDVLRAVPWRVVIALLLVLAVLAAPAVTALLVRRRRWAAATTPAARAEAAWTTLVEELGDLGLVVASALTVRQTSRLVGENLDQDASASMDRIARAVERQRYAPPAGTGLLHRGAPGSDRSAVSVLDLDAPATTHVADPLTDRGLRHDVLVVVRAVGRQRPDLDTWRARLVPRSGTAHLRGQVQRLGLLADRWDRTVSSRLSRRRPRD